MDLMDKFNKLSRSEFISTFGNIFEKTEWIAENAMIQNLIVILMN